MAYWRVAIMGAIFVLLGIAIVNLYHVPLEHYGDILALCLIGGEFGVIELTYRFGMITVLLTSIFKLHDRGCKTF